MFPQCNLHLLCHNNHWEIEHAGDGGFALIPPPDIDPQQTAIPMPTKSAAIRELQARAHTSYAQTSSHEGSVAS